MKKYKDEIILFTNSMLIMVLELTASRIVSPYIGNSTLVWTALIGIIMGSLSLGYFLGGRLIDYTENRQAPTAVRNVLLPSLFLIAAGYLMIIHFTGRNFLPSLLSLPLFWNLKIVLSCSILFVIPSVFMGMVSPYLIKRNLQEMKGAGGKIGTLNAISTFGSIIGTFLAGFYLIPFWGTNYVVLGIILLLLLLALFSQERFSWKFFSVVFGLFILLLLLHSIRSRLFQEEGLLIDTDSEYSRIFIRDIKEEGDIHRYIYNDNLSYHSGISLLEPEKLLFEYTQFYDLFQCYTPEAQQLLMLGGGAFSYPKYFISHYPEKTLDVVEIDKKFTQLAKEYFFLTEKPNLHIYHEDARVYLNQNKKRYDVILNDCYNQNLSIPYHLVTQEFVQSVKNSLSPKGCYILNVVSPVEGNNKFLSSIVQTIQTVFPYVDIFRVKKELPKEETQNSIVVAYFDKPTSEREETSFLKFSNARDSFTPSKETMIFTDQRNPADIWVLQH